MREVISLFHHHNHFSEKELIMDLFIFEKQISSAYNAAVSETSCSSLRQHLLKCLQQIREIQTLIIENMMKRGWYQFRPVHLQDLENAKIKYNHLQNELR